MYSAEMYTYMQVQLRKKIFFSHRWAPTNSRQISTCVWDQCWCTCGSSPWSHSFYTIPHHLRPQPNYWLTDGRVSPDKMLKWLITDAHLSTWGGSSMPGTLGPMTVNSSLVDPPETLRQIPQNMTLCGQHHCIYVSNSEVPGHIKHITPGRHDN